MYYLYMTKLGESSKKKTCQTWVFDPTGGGGLGDYPPGPNLYFEEVKTTSNWRFTPLIFGCGGQNNE